MTSRVAFAAGAVVAVAGVLAVRGGVAFHAQFWNQAARAHQEDSLPVQVAPSKPERLARATRLVAGMGKQGQVTDVFSAADGTTGVVIRSAEGSFIGWTVDGIDALFVGAKFDPAGRNATQQEMLARGFAAPSVTPPGTAGQRPPVSENGALLRAADRSVGFIEGRSGPVWTAYVDGNCAYCAQLWRQLRVPIADGRIRVRWAPVAVLGPTSAGKAATLLQSAAPADVLAAHAATGAPLADSAIAEPIRHQIDANTAMLRALSPGEAPATPTLVVPLRGVDPLVVRGLPADIAQLLKQAGV